MALGIELSNVGLTFAAAGVGTEVIRSLDLTVAPNSVHVVVGPNGCGKSTLLRLLAGVLRPSAGKIRFVGEQRHSNRTALVFQDPTLLPWWNIGRNVSIGTEMGKRTPPLEKQTRKSLLEKVRSFHTEQVGLGGMGKRMPGELSHGMKTRAGVARAFAHDADIVLMDEPFVHLDWITKRRLWDEFETHWQLDPRTYVLVTHDVDEAALLGDRVTVLSERPATVVEHIEVDLPRPRTSDLMDQPGFRSATSRIWAALDRATYR